MGLISSICGLGRLVCKRWRKYNGKSVAIRFSEEYSSFLFLFSFFFMQVYEHMINLGQIFHEMYPYTK